MDTEDEAGRPRVAEVPDSGRALHTHRAAPLLESALLLSILAHAAGMLSMGALLPGVPGGLHAGVAERVAYIAQHPWLWRLGWLPWQLSALSDLFLSVALLRTRWIPRLPAALAVVATAAAIVADQTAQFRWSWEGVTLARRALDAGDLASYTAFESRMFDLVARWGTLGYLCGALCWTWAFRQAGIWSGRLARLSVATWGVFAGATALLFLPERLQTPAVGLAVSLGNGAAFVLMMLWLVAVAERVLRRSRPDTAHGGRALWRHPSPSMLFRPLEGATNSRVARAIGRLLPTARMKSDITDVVYINYLVEAHLLEPLVRAPLALQRLGPGGRYAMFTFLTFRHGHFGPRRFGPLRRLWPSPIQSNWRIYVVHPATGTRGVQFVTTAITGTPYALVTRLLVDDVPMHVPARAELRRESAGKIHVVLEPGRGTSPDARAALEPGPEPVLLAPWTLSFADWREMLAYCVPQDRAMTVQPGSGRVLRQEIALDIPLASCLPLAGVVESAAARAIVGDARPLCFVVDRVGFEFSRAVADEPVVR